MRIRIPAGRGVQGPLGEHLEGEVEVPLAFARVLIAEGRAVAIADLAVVHHDPVAAHRDPVVKGRRR